MLIENTLFGALDRVQTAIKRLRLFSDMAVQNHPNGYAVMDSGGKDSDVIKQLALLSGVQFEVIHSHTTADHPFTIHYIRKEKQRFQALGIPYSIVYPTYKGKRTSMWALIEHKGAPTRVSRWCCDILKEHTADRRYVVTGVRWAESAKRKQSRAAYELPTDNKERIKLSNDNDAVRRWSEHCINKGQFILNPIIDWSDSDVWEFHHQYQLPHNPLYDKGYRRVGCVGCPISRRFKAELEDCPEYKNMYIHAFQRYINKHPETAQRHQWSSGEEMFAWWTNDKPAVPGVLSGQLVWDGYDK